MVIDSYACNYSQITTPSKWLHVAFWVGLCGVRAIHKYQTPIIHSHWLAIWLLQLFGLISLRGRRLFTNAVWRSVYYECQWDSSFGAYVFVQLAQSRRHLSKIEWSQLSTFDWWETFLASARNGRQSAKLSSRAMASVSPVLLLLVFVFLV